jgi:integrase
MIAAGIGKDFERYGGKAAKRGVLAVEEAGALFARPWADGAAMAANLLSATTGMRPGEVLAIRGGDIGEAVLAGNPHTDIPEAERFVFWGLAPEKPRYDGSFMLDALHAELEAIGIDWRARNIVFHGWRTSKRRIR